MNTVEIAVSNGRQIVKDASRYRRHSDKRAKCVDNLRQVIGYLAENNADSEVLAEFSKALVTLS